MSAERTPLADAVAGLLKNPAVLEGIVAGISAIGASRRVKKGNDDLFGGIMSALPQLLPLLALLAPPPASTSSSQKPAAVAASADAADDGASADDTQNAIDEIVDGGVGDADDLSGVDVSYESPQARRENLLLALRPFLSESRRGAADAMVQVNRLSGLFGAADGKDRI